MSGVSVRDGGRGGDKGQGEETRESFFTPHHTVSSGTPEGHTHTNRRDRRDSPLPPLLPVHHSQPTVHINYIQLKSSQYNKLHCRFLPAARHLSAEQQSDGSTL